MVDEPRRAAPSRTGEPLVRVERDGPVATLVLDSPHNRNALSTRLLTELGAALGACGEDDGIRVVVLTATGTTFCSGADLGERLAPPAARATSDNGATATTVGDVLTVLTRTRQPVVCRVNGHVRAGGIGLVASCDLAVAAEEATFAFSEVRVGVAPAVIAVPALRVVDRRSLVRHTLTGERFDASAAAACGLLTAAVPADRLDRWVGGVVASLLQGSPTAITATKRLLDTLGGRPWDETLVAAAAESDRLFASPDGIEGITAFLGKRPPSWVATVPTHLHRG